MHNELITRASRALLGRRGAPTAGAITDEGGEIRPSREELDVSFSDLGGVTITRSRAIKLAGAALVGSAFSLFWATEADARRRRKRRRRRRRKAQVTPNPVPLVPGTPTIINITNPSDRPLTISEVQVLDSEGNLLFDALTGDVTIDPNTTAPVTLTVNSDDPLADASNLRLIDGAGVPIEILNGPIEVDLL